MSSPINAAPQELSRPHISNLLNILRRANARYAQVAAAVRNTLRPTYHARKRARSLRLSVSIEAALKLDPKQISTIPLPIIEIATLPPQEAPRDRPTLRCDIPESIHPEEMLSSVSVYSNVSLASTTSSDAQLTSRWSMTTVDSDIKEGGEEEQDIDYSSDYEEGMDLPVSAEAEIEYASFDMVSRPFGNVAGHCAPCLEIPVDVSPLSPLNWGSDLSRGLSSGPSSSSGSSDGPVTPGGCEHPEPKLVTCVKRKSIASDIDMEDGTIEKRPKYERKSWTNPAIRRTVAKMLPTRRY